MRTCTVVLLAVVCCCVFGLSAQPKGTAEKPRKSEQIHKQIETLRGQIEALEKEAEEADAIEEQKDALARLQEESRDRMAEYDERMKDIMNAEEPGTDERNKYYNALISHVNKCRAIDKKILALKDYKSLEQARKLYDEIEAAAAEWDMVLERKYDIPARIADMRNAMAEVGGHEFGGLIKEIHTLHAQDMTAAKKQFEIWKARRANRKTLDARIEHFWQMLAAAEEKQEEEEDAED